MESITASEVCVTRKHGVCRCCLAEGTFKSMETTHTWRRRVNNYAEMLLETFNLALLKVETSSVSPDRLICGLCACRLRQACTFYQQVRASEEAFIRLHSGSECTVQSSEEVKVEPREESELGIAFTEAAHSNEADEGADDFALSDPEDDVPLNTIPQARPKGPPASAVGALPIAALLTDDESQSKGTSSKTTPRKCRERPTTKKRNMRRKTPSVPAETVVIVNSSEVIPCDRNMDVDAKAGKLSRTRVPKTAKLKRNTEASCEQCGKAFRNVQYLRRHVIEVHDRAPRHKCPECAALFNTHRCKRNHMQAAHGIAWNKFRVFKCRTCDQCFDTAPKRRAHNKQAHAINQCPHCSERFTNYYYKCKHIQQAHNRIERTYPCGACDKTFKENQYLVKHQRRVHLMERNYPCTQCESRFFARSHLRMHMVKHTAERAHECDVCKKRFPRRNTLLYHRRIHTGDKRMVCKVCGQAFVQTASLKYHMSRHHPEA